MDFQSPCKNPVLISLNLMKKKKKRNKAVTSAHLVNAGELGIILNI